MPINSTLRRTGLRSKVSLLVTLAIALSGCGGTSKPPYLVYVTNEGSGDLSVIDPNKSEAIDRIELGKRPRGIRGARKKYLRCA